MIFANSISLSLTGSWLFNLICLFLLAIFSYYIYKYTIPVVSIKLRYFLLILRAIILILLFLLILQPIFSITNVSTVESKILLFIDNSISIAEKDSSNRKNKIIQLASNLKDSFGKQLRLFTFGNRIDSIRENISSEIMFNKNETNFSKIIEKFRHYDQSINSAVIVSDGIITNGTDPAYIAEKLQFPIFTIGVGDSTEKKDISVFSVNTNQFVYLNKATTIEVTIKNSGFDNAGVRVSLYDENSFLASKELILNNIGINKINFNYKPVKSGERKFNIKVSTLNGELTTDNNEKSFYINVLDTKLKIAIVSSTPSADLSAIANAIAMDKNITTIKLIQVSANKFWNNENPNTIDSADVLFLIDFPGANTPASLIDKVLKSIAEFNKPFFFLLSKEVYLGNLKQLDKVLPFSYNDIAYDFFEVQPNLNENAFATFSQLSNKKQIWNNLPPVNQFAVELLAKPGNTVLAKSKVRNIPIVNPLIILRNLGKQRSFAILAGDIWKWQLQTAERNPEFFSNFINDVVKWLWINADQKQFSVNTEKNIYNLNEEINVNARLYDQTFSPIDTAQINIYISKGEVNTQMNSVLIWQGIYNSVFIPSEAGNYSLYAETRLGNNIIKSNISRFSVNNISLEKLDTRMRPEFLRTLAKSTNAEYYSIENYYKLFDKLTSINNDSRKEIQTKSDYQLWTNELLLVIIIILFTIEWFIRKRVGML